MIRDSSRDEVPRASSERISKSSDTDGSPASIFATRDWLDRRAFANATWVIRRCRRRARKLLANRILSSTYAASSSDSPRKSSAEPTFQPLASSLFFFSSRILIFLQPVLASRNNRRRRGSRLLCEYLQDHNGIRSHMVDNPPCGPFINDTQLIAARANRWHWSRMRQTQRLAGLKPAQEVARFQPSPHGEGRRFHLAVQPYQGLVSRAHPLVQYVESDMTSSSQQANHGVNLTAWASHAPCLATSEQLIERQRAQGARLSQSAGYAGR